MRIILTDALTEPLEIAGIGEFFRQYLTWDYWSQKLPLIGSFAGRVLLAILVYVVASKIIHKLCKLIVASMNRANADTGVTQFVSSFAKAAMYFFLIVSIATSFGVKESSIAALLASSGVAIGLALQGGLSNLAGGVIILILRPFVIGDYIIENAGHQEGTVVKIDLFYTTLSTVDNRRITVPNGTLTNSSIVNVTAKDNRKLEIKVGRFEKSQENFGNTAPRGCQYYVRPGDAGLCGRAGGRQCDFGTSCMGKDRGILGDKVAFE